MSTVALDTVNDRVGVFSASQNNAGLNPICETSPFTLVSKVLGSGQGISLAVNPSTGKVTINGPGNGEGVEIDGSNNIDLNYKNLSAVSTLSPQDLLCAFVTAAGHHRSISYASLYNEITSGFITASQLTGYAKTPGLQVFWSSGTYNPTPGKTSALVFCTGGGGGASHYCSITQPGGAGATAITIVPLSGSSIPVTIGAGGYAVTWDDANGGSGGTSAFGSYAIAGGGSGGSYSAPGQASASAGMLQIPTYGGAPFWGEGGPGGGYPWSAGRSGIVVVVEF